MEKIIHQIWVGSYEMPDREKYFVQLIKEKNPEFKHILWTNENLFALDEKIAVVYDNFMRRKDYANAADILRVVVVREFGGVYFDVDYKCNKGIENWELEKHDGLLVYHEEFTSGNGEFGCNPKTGFIEYLYQDLLKSYIGCSFDPHWFNTNMKRYFKIKNIESYTSEECKVMGMKLLETWKKENIKYVRRHGEFEPLYFEHHALHSWDDKHKKYFEEGLINYQEVIYNRTYK